ncbi:hypothetical protein BD626DRAFT_254667 [Schizophyllum amplum]|uniref:Uncharacterized protein n=1 Tax=Schizophyllum amplum TaxID=97359 RepID=A0A550CID4_9AGAR|nr:hypothetical protein BD626DRAFT_254667 [Auriculariopsis ampla]
MVQPTSEMVQRRNLRSTPVGVGRTTLHLTLWSNESDMNAARVEGWTLSTAGQGRTFATVHDYRLSPRNLPALALPMTIFGRRAADLLEALPAPSWRSSKRVFAKSAGTPSRQTQTTLAAGADSSPSSMPTSGTAFLLATSVCFCDSKALLD